MTKKIRYLIRLYNQDVEKLSGSKRSEVSDEVNYKIKWTRAVKNDLVKGIKYSFRKSNIVINQYRPFAKYWMYFSKELNEMQYELPRVFPRNGKNIAIAFSGLSSSKPFQCLACSQGFNHDMLEKTQCLPLYRYTDDGTRVENITDWGLEQFRKKYSRRDLINQIPNKDVMNHVLTVAYSATVGRGISQCQRRRLQILLKKTSSITFTPCCTIPRTERNTKSISSANFRAYRCITTSGNGQRGASN